MSLSATSHLRNGLLALALLGLGLLNGCASPVRQTDTQIQALFQDTLFQPSPVVPVQALFAPSEAMQRFVDETVRPKMRHVGPSRALIEALHLGKSLRIDYDATETRTAAETFASSSGNCLSLVIMTATLAKQLGLPVSYQAVDVSNAWSRNRNTYFRLGHVNITIGYRDLRGTARYVSDPAWTIDFFPAEDRQRMASSEISEARITAMYLNNRAAELMLSGQLDGAYWHARSAVLADPTFVTAFNTLGVIYHRHGNLAAAEAVFSQTLAQHGDEPLALSNLALVLEAQGKTELARQAENRLGRIDKENPFRDLLISQAALAQGQYQEALRYFKRELRRDPDYHETHFGLAVAYFKLGNLPAAGEHLRKAQTHAETRQDKIRYAAKLERLQAKAAGS